MQLTVNRTTIAAAAAAVVALTGAAWLLASNARDTHPTSADGLAEFKAPARSPDLSGAIHEKLATAPLPVGAEIPPIKLPPPPDATGALPIPATLPMPSNMATAPAAPQGMPAAAELARQSIAAARQGQQDGKAAAAGLPGTAPAIQDDDPVMARIARYGVPVTKQALPVGGLTLWTVISQSGKSVQLYTTADGKALISGVVWNLDNGQNVTQSLMAPPSGNDPDFAARLPKVVAPARPASHLVSGKNALPAAFDGKAPTDIPEAIRLVDGLAGYKEGKGGMADTLYVIIDPRCPYCRRAYLNTREYVKQGITIKWIPTAALGRPEQGLPLAATILRASNPEVVARVLGNHEQLATPPTDFELKQLDNNLDFMFEAFKQNNEPNPGVPVAFFIDRRSGKARMMMGVSEQVVIEDILGKPKK